MVLQIRPTIILNFKEVNMIIIHHKVLITIPIHHLHIPIFPILMILGLQIRDITNHQIPLATILHQFMIRAITDHQIHMIIINKMVTQDRKVLTLMEKRAHIVTILNREIHIRDFHLKISITNVKAAIANLGMTGQEEMVEVIILEVGELRGA